VLEVTVDRAQGLKAVNVRGRPGARGALGMGSQLRDWRAGGRPGSPPARHPSPPACPIPAPPAPPKKSVVAGGASDPYVVVTCADSSGRTEVKWGTTAPVWGETFRLFVRWVAFVWGPW
jgi:hypothetical protein